MCKGLDAWEKRDEERDKKCGILKGVTKLLEPMRVLADQGYQMEDVLDITAEEAFIRNIE